MAQKQVERAIVLERCAALVSTTKERAGHSVHPLVKQISARLSTSPAAHRARPRDHVVRRTPEKACSHRAQH